MDENTTETYKHIAARFAQAMKQISDAMSEERMFRFSLERAGLDLKDLVPAELREQSRQQYITMSDLFLRESEAMTNQKARA